MQIETYNALQHKQENSNTNVESAKLRAFWEEIGIAEDWDSPEWEDFDNMIGTIQEEYTRKGKAVPFDLRSDIRTYLNRIHAE